MAPAAERYIREYSTQLLGFPLDRETPSFALCLQRLNSMLEYHRGRFAGVKKTIFRDEDLLENLRQGEFGVGQREGYDLVADVILAALLEGSVKGAADAFEKRFHPQLEKWARRYAPEDDQIVDDFLTDLLLPRKKSGPRISTYKGQGPLDGWLKRVFKSQVIRRQEETDPVIEPPLGDIPSCRIDPGDEYARQECTEKLTPAFTTMFDVLDDAHRTVLQMSVMDEVEQKKIAAFFGVRDYKITRMKQEAIGKVVKAFFVFATNKTKMTLKSVQECLELIMDKFGDGEMASLLTLKKMDLNN